jgi:hypothetical protein
VKYNFPLLRNPLIPLQARLDGTLRSSVSSFKAVGCRYGSTTSPKCPRANLLNPQKLSLHSLTKFAANHPTQTSLALRHDELAAASRQVRYVSVPAPRGQLPHRSRRSGGRQGAPANERRFSHMPGPPGPVTPVLRTLVDIVHL